MVKRYDAIVAIAPHFIPWSGPWRKGSAAIFDDVDDFWEVYSDEIEEKIC